jgi:antitoxin YefM
MPGTTLTRLRANLEKYCDRAVSSRKPIRIKREHGGDVVLVAASEFDSLMETAYVMSSERNRKRLLGALERIVAGKRLHEAEEEQAGNHSPKR